MAHINASPGPIQLISLRLSNARVKTITKIRHDNLLILIKRAGKIQTFADRVGRSHSQISQLKNRSPHSKSGLPREIGDDIARLIESTHELPEGWMDVEHEDGNLTGGLPPTVVQEPIAPYVVRSWPFTRVTLEQIQSLPSYELALIEGYIARIIEESNNRKG